MGIKKLLIIQAKEVLLLLLVFIKQQMMYKLIIFLFLLSCYSCGSNSCIKYYAFEFPITVSPAQDTFQVGDTIWYEMSLPNDILDKNSGEYIDFSEFELFFSINLDKVDTNVIYGATLLFDLYAERGSIEQNVNSFVYTYIHFDSIKDKKFKIGVIPKEKGVFASTINLPSHFSRIETSDTERLNLAESDCIEYMVRECRLPVNNGDINYYLVDGVCKWSSDSLEICYGTYEEGVARGGFAFVVE